MRKIVWTFGIIAGLIPVAMFFIMMPAEGEAMNFEEGQTWGILTMLLAFSTVFFGVYQYRKKRKKPLKFGRSFLIGLYITLIASGIYVLGWELFYQNFASDFSDQYMEYQRESLAQEGMDAPAIDRQLADEREMMQRYKDNTLFRMAVTFSEIFPVGLLVSLLSAVLFSVFLKPKPLA